MNTIIAATWKELLRRKMLLLTAVLTLLFLAVFWYIAGTVALNVPDGTRMLEQFARRSAILSLGFFFGGFVVAFLAIFSSFSVISGEAEQGVLQSVLTRPIPRWKWYVGRWLGYVSLIGAYALLLFVSIVWITGVHAGMTRNYGDLAVSLLLFALMVPVLVSASMLGSSLFSGIGNGVFMTMLYGAGWLGGMVEKVRGVLPVEPDAQQTLSHIGVLLSLAMPADGLNRRMQFILTRGAGETIPFLTGGTPPSNAFVWYAAAFAIFAFGLGLWLFRRKDF
ncbi:ABC transporter permease [Saccharibacillus sp. CPCC 101409]|uniref:ABC transporter permease n=1 Tax=Saccharibacillus sp. CPCC 101409 TaxID=3058041 RepID=UPI002673F4FB|nr:ABC transporter permease [Saccharibacillus sp. CPCC 101409]MDO3411779.1 ABC transporter permease [Saccharibacillus sp. CPCC 101409]